VVVLVATLQPWRGINCPRLGASATIEAAAGAMDRWGVRLGSRLSIHPGSPVPTEGSTDGLTAP
jgi:uncharacterized protein